jgi:hypothetical protein
VWENLDASSPGYKGTPQRATQSLAKLASENCGNLIQGNVGLFSGATVPVFTLALGGSATDDDDVGNTKNFGIGKLDPRRKLRVVVQKDVLTRGF